MKLKLKHLLGIEELTKDELISIIQLSKEFKEISLRRIKKVPTLRGVSVILFFAEPSTRTRTSFEIAAKRLSADTISITASASSLVKGETLIDTAKNLQAMNPDILIIRHSAVGAPYILSKIMKASIINAGDGAHEHPTQALVDCLTIFEHKERFEGLKVAIIGDISHSRVARSNIWALTKLGVDVNVASPKTMLPRDIEKIGVKVHLSMEDAIKDADVIMMLRIQKERFKDPLFSTIREYSIFYGLTEKKLKIAKPDVIVLHPGPINRGVEISPDVAYSPYSVILEQVENGVAVRMAILYILTSHIVENNIEGGEK